MALFTVVVATSVLVAIFVFSATFFASQSPARLPAAVSNALGAFLITMVFYAAGMTLLSAPVWALLHHAGKRQWPYAVATGFLIPFCLALLLSFAPSGSDFSSYAEGGQLWIKGQMTDFAMYLAIRNAFFLGSIGAAQGVSVWYLAYRL